MSDSVLAVVGMALAAIAIWFTVRIVNSPKKFVADLVTFRMLFFWTGVMGAVFGFSVDCTPTVREIAGPSLKGMLTGTGIGLLFGWLVSQRDVSPPTDDQGRR